MDEEIKRNLDEAVELMDEFIRDRGVPRNIRGAVEEAKQKVSQEDAEDIGLNISTAIYVLDDISNDINMPSHARTEIWTIISQLEAVKERLK